MTKKHFIRAAEIVNNIRKGDWTGELPSWSPIACSSEWEIDACELGNLDRDIFRAVQTAEAFIILFAGENPRFDQNRFLVACGLAEKPTKAKKAK